MGYDRRWLDEPHVGDHVGRSIWALGDVLATAWIPAVVRPAGELLDRLVGTLAGDVHLRTAAYAVLGLSRLDPDRLDPAAHRLLERLVEQLADAYERTASEDWRWFEDRRGISNLTVARSANGIDGWSIAPEPLLTPDDVTVSEQWGFEDARVVWVAELERWVITCTAYDPAGPAVFLATTDDFRTVERYGVVRHPEDKNAALLPHRIDGRWVLLHRPKTEFGGGHG